MNTINVIITTDSCENQYTIETNALLANALLLYQLIEKIDGYVPFLLTPDRKSNGPLVVHEYEYRYVLFSAEDIRGKLSNLKNIFLQVFFHFDAVTIEKLKYILENSCKFICIEYGNKFNIDISNYFYLGENYDSSVTNQDIHRIYDDIWISPHYEYQTVYISKRHKIPKRNVKVCPYIWSSSIIDYKNKEIDYTFNEKYITNIGIYEGNIMPQKTCIIPMYICDELHEQCESVHITNLTIFSKKQVFHQHISELQLSMTNKLSTVNSSVNLLRHMKENNIGCVVSHQMNNSLNYLYLEMMHLRVPLIHNSDDIKEYGYYYPDLDIDKGSEQLQDVFNQHAKNIETYESQCKECIYKFSIDNPDNILGYKTLLESVFLNED